MFKRHINKMTLSYQIVLLTWTTISILSCTYDDDKSFSQSTQRNTTKTLSQSLEKKYAEAIAPILPDWNSETINATPKELHSSSFFKNSDTLFLDVIGKENAVFNKDTRNGNQVYNSQDSNTSIKVNKQKGYWKFVEAPQNYNVNALKNKLTDEHALRKTESIFRKFGLSEGERGNVVSVGVGNADMGPDGVMGQSYVTARHVRILREINGIQVKDSHFMTTFDLTGNLFRAEMRWPEFKLDQDANLIPKEQIIGALAKKMATNFPNSDTVNEFKSAIEYQFNEETLFFEPVLFVYAVENGSLSPLALRYSLTNGLLNGRQPLPSDLNIDKDSE